MRASALPQHPITRLARPLTAPLILLLAAWLRFYHLSGQSLWADEGNSVALTRRGFVEIARRTAFDIHPPLYYWLLKIWTAIFGDGEIGLRSLSVLLGIVLVYLIGVLGVRLFSSRVGLIAAFIAALSPLQVYYSQETRMYMLLTLLGTLTVLIALLILESYRAEEKIKTATGFMYVLTVTAGLYTHYAYPLILLAVNLTALTWFWQTRQSETPTQNLTIPTTGTPASAGQRSKIRPGARNQNPARDKQAQGMDPKSATPPRARKQKPARDTQAQGMGPKSEIRNLKSEIGSWFVLQLIPLLLYLPWLPIAWRQITTWPLERQAGSLPAILQEISTTLLFGLSWPFDLGPVTVIGLGVVLLVTLWPGLKKDTPHVTHPIGSRPTSLVLRVHAGISGQLALILLWLWLLLPVVLTAIIFGPAFLKFLLAATPPLALLAALAIEWLALKLGRSWPGAGLNAAHDGSRPTRRVSWFAYLVGGALLAALTGASAISLYHYYADPAYARDNYRGIANFIKGVGGPQAVVILNAEGQQDVFNYYYERGLAPSTSVYPLPRQRPLDEAATLNELQQISDNAGKVYAVYWATRQADPNGLIEGWLDSRLFKATDRWYGNVRLASYASPQAGANPDLTAVDYQLGQHIRLTGYALSSTRIAPGDILQVALSWEKDRPLTENFTVFAQILDQANHVVGQRDAQPLTAVPNWPAGEPVTDGHGIFIEPGTPPGKHRLIVGLYDSPTGRRLPVTSEDGVNEDEGRDFIELGEVEVVRPAIPLPLEAFDIQVPLDTPMLDVMLLGYDLYKTGHRSTPDTPLHPDDPLHLVAYWTPRQPVRRLEDQLFIQVITNSSRSSRLFVTRTPSGTDYSIKVWQPGEIIRAQYDIFLNNLEPGTYRLALTLGVSKISTRQIVAVTKPFRVE